MKSSGEGMHSDAALTTRGGGSLESGVTFGSYQVLIRRGHVLNMIMAKVNPGSLWWI